MASRGTSATEGNIERLGAKLKALSSMNRLRLVDELDEPKTVDDIHLTPSGPGEDADADRQLTRQGVRHHLSRLEDADLVRSTTRPNQRGRDRREYMVNEPAVFGLLEELRGLLGPGGKEPLDPFKTEAASPRTEQSNRWLEGPKLVLLKGAEDDRVFNLRQIDPDPASGRGWVIGRSNEAQIALPYDPYLSGQNTEILEEDGEYRIVDLRISTNGTQLNDERLKPGQETPLEHGDIVKVGCSSLVFHER
jgi:DNA-binding transcriptional ArsR family regulator